MVSIIRTVDTGHEDLIHDAVMDYYGLQLATCSSDHSVKIYSLKSAGQTLIADLKGHLGPVWQLSWAHPRFGNILASCSYDRKVIIWKENGEWGKLYEFCKHDSSVNSVAWGPQEYGLVLACGSLDGTISILTYYPESNCWDSKRLNAHTSGCNAVSWCPAASPITSFDVPGGNRLNLFKRLASGGCDNLIKIWKEDDEQWIEETKLEVHSDWVRDVAWAPSFGLSKHYIASCSQDHRVVISSSEDYIHWKSVVLHTFDDVMWGVSWSLTANILAVSGSDNQVTLWRMNAEEQWTCISEVVKGEGDIGD